MPLHTLLLFLAASVVITLSPGPDILTVITRAITQGPRAGLIAACGFSTGLIVHTTLAALGLSALVAQSPRALFALKIAGALYLLALALQLLLKRESAATAASSDSKAVIAAPLARIYTQSILMNILNPKVILFFLAFLPQFTDPASRFAPALQFVILGALFTLTTLVCFSAAAIFAARLSRFLRQSSRAARPLRIATALVFLLIALRLTIA